MDNEFEIKSEKQIINNYYDKTEKIKYEIGGSIKDNNVEIYVYETSPTEWEHYGCTHGQSISLNKTQLDELITQLQKLREQIT